jgi:hypothetical protein
MKRPLGVTVVAVLMCIGAGLLAVGSLGFFVLGGVVVAAEAGDQRHNYLREWEHSEREYSWC